MVLLGSPVTGAEAAVASLSIQQRPVIGYHLASKKVVFFGQEQVIIFTPALALFQARP